MKPNQPQLDCAGCAEAAGPKSRRYALLAHPGIRFRIQLCGTCVAHVEKHSTDPVLVSGDNPRLLAGGAVRQVMRIIESGLTQPVVDSAENDFPRAGDA